ncbi:hypothetical protein HETIRDRAFT_312169 [Heterobasidion irregulare TC 32-1]|uniref:Uncharacterized protein n=1 Tax=Heterobasidion irregulare (strain TC 32-1) TaxID=747525 RepID=W4KHB1_HETIT|nr:uncharacterized protein HETIRDRAFT_312169 [Heterobasidion irregulare TC 32-1]ETW84710.1 hypothetical protein HETIRDRAFT_312169 [Heterobasidion irregulare TC 32-1]
MTGIQYKYAIWWLSSPSLGAACAALHTGGPARASVRSRCKTLSACRVRSGPTVPRLGKAGWYWSRCLRGRVTAPGGPTLVDG